ncbi:hypothetical protein [Nostoc sp.]|uniref:hypothetical protein n=1 Tax=Nostoc sp. TaxID=1180 RepID=UPI002FF68DA4
MFRQLDLCSGVGAGFCLAGLQHGFNLIGTAEIDEYCSGILDCDIQELTTTATCKHLPTPEHLDCDQEQSTSSLGERTATWTDQARGWIEGFKGAAKRRGIEPGYPLRVVRTPAELARPLGVKSGNGTVRKQRAAAGNLLEPRVAAIALNRIAYLNSITAQSQPGGYSPR